MRMWLLISCGAVAFLTLEIIAEHSPGRDRDRVPLVLPEQPDDPLLPGPPQPSERIIQSHVSFFRGPFESIQVNVGELGDNIVGDAANEPSIAIDPTDPNIIVIGWRQFDNVASNFRQAGWGYSDDGGSEWTFPGVFEPGVFRSDPVLDSDTDGNIYYYSLTDDFTADMFKSTDGGVSWADPVPAFGGDKAWMAIDRTGGPGNGNIYAKWQTFFNCCDENTFTRSLDGGQTFMDPIPVPLGPSFGTLTVGPDGEVYVAGIWAVNFQDFSRVVIARSTAASEPVGVQFFDLALDVELGGSQVISAGPNPAGLLGQVCVATDHSNGPTRGNVYVLASVNPPGPDPLDVMFIRSEDSGASWSAPIRVNDDSAGTNAWQWFGAISVAPTGRIDVIWNDTRTAGVNNLSELFYAYSTDAGDTWSMNIPVSIMFNSHVGWPQQNKLGDYYDLISDDAGLSIAYAATFNNEQDVYFLRLGDCNNNGVHDGIDLADETSSDNNANGIPDDCECFAYGDVDLSGQLDLDDLMCQLDGLSGALDCAGVTAEDLDIHPCVGNGDLNLLDLVAMLDALAGSPGCADSCP